MRRIFSFFAVLAVFLLCVHCGGETETLPPPTVEKAPVVENAQPASWIFDCEDGYVFTVHFRGNDAVVVLPDQTVTLPRAISGSGARYSNGEITFWTKGDSARLEIGGDTHEACPGTPVEEEDREELQEVEGEEGIPAES
jgi:membrane-bound inhibitor of C-type lysozyme